MSVRYRFTQFTNLLGMRLSWCNCARWPHWGRGLEGQKLTPEQVQRYGRRLTTHQRMKDKITATGDDMHVSTQVIYSARWSVNGLGVGQQGIDLTALWALPFWTVHVLSVRHMMRMRIPSIWADSLLSHFIVLSWCSLDWVNHQTCYIMHQVLNWYIDMPYMP